MIWNREKNNNSHQDSDENINESTRTGVPTYDSANDLGVNESINYSGFVVRNTFAPPNPDSDSDLED